jgi:carbonic anhydrase
VTGDEALARLIEGNRRFVLGQVQQPGALARATAEPAPAHPFAFVLGCYDARVGHEIVFDQGLGSVYSSRTAGNLLDDAILGGIEFAVQELGVPLVLILGHQSCRAAAATVDALASGASLPGMIGTVVEALRPAVELARTRPGEPVESAIRANVELGVARVKASPVVAPAVARGAVKVLGAYYSLDTRLVDVIA